MPCAAVNRYATRCAHPTFVQLRCWCASKGLHVCTVEGHLTEIGGLCGGRGRRPEMAGRTPRMPRAAKLQMQEEGKANEEENSGIRQLLGVRVGRPPCCILGLRRMCERGRAFATCCMCWHAFEKRACRSSLERPTQDRPCTYSMCLRFKMREMDRAASKPRTSGQFACSSRSL